jgi:hypothetical protein
MNSECECECECANSSNRIYQAELAFCSSCQRASGIASLSPCKLSWKRTPTTLSRLRCVQHDNKVSARAQQEQSGRVAREHSKQIGKAFNPPMKRGQRLHHVEQGVLFTQPPHHHRRTVLIGFAESAIRPPWKLYCGQRSTGNPLK